MSVDTYKEVYGTIESPATNMSNLIQQLETISHGGRIDPNRKRLIDLLLACKPDIEEKAKDMEEVYNMLMFEEYWEDMAKFLAIRDIYAQLKSHHDHLISLIQYLLTPSCRL
eukprot:TRINITY_DN5270_c0_g1_i1.p1 TRINITY_DN5270_c0_g1~~TRINITY_DN5270_c0_g1_i1.p1  ORF type:complete len:112 (-),score=21.41 TRINITY_DN5270_c0_g1_i1:23-358(-)